MKIFLVAGGTGGHILPAIVFGDWLNREKNLSSLHYICGNRSLELEIYGHSGIDPLILPIEGSPFGISGIMKKLKRTYNIAKSIIYMYSLVRKYKPDACFMFGGYVSFPALLACSIANVPIIMHEQNAIAGKVTRFAERIGKTVVKSWDDKTTSNIPVRQLVLWDRQIVFEKYNINTHWFHSKIICILGGSLASISIADVLEAIVKSFPQNLFLILSEKGDIEAENVLFIGKQWDMNPVFSIVDLAISRGGASTLAELEAYNISSIVIPWEKSSDNHQAANARVFSDITGNYTWRENQGIEELLHLISSGVSMSRELKTGLHDSASINLFESFKTKYGDRGNFE